MSSALKPALTPSGVQNQPVPSQLNKPIHTQGPPTTYGQPMSHMPQNLVNPGNVHNQVHGLNANVHTGHPPNHYSINVPNASQHYPISGNIPISTHSAPISNHPVPNTTQAHVQPPSTFSPSPKNLSYNPNYQSNVAHSYKMTNVTSSSPTIPVSQSQQPPTENAPVTDKPQSNGTSDIKIATKPEPSQNHVAPVVIEKSIQPPQIPTPEIQVPSTPEKAKTVPEPSLPEPEESIKEPDEESKPSDAESTPPPKVEDSSTLAMAAATADNSISSSANTSATSTESNPPSATEPAADSTSAEVVEADQPPSPPPLQSTEVPEQVSDEGDNSSSPTNTTVSKTKDQNNQKSPAKVATTPRNASKKPKLVKPETETPKVSKQQETKPLQKSPSSGGKSKRTRTKTQPYQSPLPEVEMISKITATTPRSRNSEDKLIIFYKNEFLAVRNSEGGFYICQALQNIYKSSPRIRIRWLSQDKNDKELYTPDFYDNTDFDCILTNLNLSRAGKGKYKLPAAEKVRTDSILKRALAVEKGDEKPTSLTEEHPDGLDLSLYKEESQLKKRKTVKRKASSPLKDGATSSHTSSKSPEQPKVQKVAPKPKPPPVKKATVLKKALSTKLKKVNPPAKIVRPDRPVKRYVEEIKNSTKAVPIIDQKKAKVLAKVARKTVVPNPKNQPPPKQSAKISKPTAAVLVPVASTKKVVAKKIPPVAITRQSKRGKK